MLQLFSQSPLGLHLVSLNMHCPGVRRGNFHDVGNGPGEKEGNICLHLAMKESKAIFGTGKRTPKSGSWSREVHSHSHTQSDLETKPRVKHVGFICRDQGQVALQMGTAQSNPQPWPSGRDHGVKP